MNAPMMVSTSSSKEEQFIQDLVQFFKNKGIQSVDPAQFIARLNGNVVPLSELYSHVLEAGGSYKVNQLNLWDEIYFKIFKSNLIGSNFNVALRQIYNRYLLQYEKENSGGQASEPWNEEEDGESLFRTAALTIANQSFYPHNLHQAQQSNKHNKRQVDDVTESNGVVHNNLKLYCSLLSGLPNELSFAFNIATILSNGSRIDWADDYKFVNVCLESIKNYCCICDQFANDGMLGQKWATEEDEVETFTRLIQARLALFEKQSNNKDQRGKRVNGTTSQSNGTVVVELGDDDDDEVELLDDKIIEPPKTEEIPIIESNCHCYQEFWYRTCQDEEILALALDDDDIDFDSPSNTKRKFPMHLMSKVEQRIELVGELIRNTSFTYDQTKSNRVSMVALIRFIALLARSENVRFLNLALDILANISPALKFMPRSKPNANVYNQLLDILFNQIAGTALNSGNLHETTKCFEILSRYIAEAGNDAFSFLENYFQDNQLYNRITHLLTCQYEVTLLLALLEFCYNVSETRPGFLTNNENKTLIKLLLTLLNSEASQHFSTGALKKIKMYDERPRTESQEATRNTIFINRPTTGNQMLGQAQQTMVPKVNNLMQQQQQQPQPNIIENEVYANNWLKSNYDEVQGGGPIKIQDIYAEYVKFCCRNSRKNVIANQSFNLLLRKCFPSCIINALTVEGIVSKLQQQQQQQHALPPQAVVATGPLVPGQPNPLMSPILKAHLSTPPKANSPMPSNTVEMQQQQQQPTTTTTSTLIKSLLANKLRSNQQIVTVPSSTPNLTVNMNKIGTTSIGGSATNQIVIQNAVNQQQQPGTVIVQQQQPQQQPQTPNIPNAITTNNFIGASAQAAGQPQQAAVMHHPQQQQLMLVRTIITMPNGQNNQAVRLILPTSMLQQRLPVSGVNGLIAAGNTLPNNLVQTVATSQPIAVQQSNVVLAQQQPQPQTPTSVAAFPAQVAPLSPSVASSEPAKPAPLVAQTPTASSPLLNVLLDKGKLPEAVVVGKEQSSIPTAVATPPAAAASATTSVNNIDTKPVVVVNTNVAPTTPTTPLVNGDVKLNDLLAKGSTKHPLESVPNEDFNKKLKTESSVATTVVTTKQEPAEQPSTIVNNIHQDSNKDGKPNGDPMVVHNKVVQPPVNHAPVGPSLPSVPTAASPIVPPTQPRLVQPPASPAVVSAPKSDPTGEFECLWGQCQMKFIKPSDVFYHVHTQHIMVDTCPATMNCIWGGPEGRGPGCHAKRPKLSLLTHLEDFHCNPNVLKQELLRRKQLSMTGTTNIQLVQPPAHPGYAQNAAMLAIKRISNMIEPILSEPTNRLTPLTVSIRLTSALILRNLAERSQAVKKILELYEPMLCEITTIDGRDESRTIAQMLATLNGNETSSPKKSSIN